MLREEDILQADLWYAYFNLAASMQRVFGSRKQSLGKTIFHHGAICTYSVPKGPNVACYKEKASQPYRQTNLKFTYLLCLRALKNAAGYLAQHALAPTTLKPFVQEADRVLRFDENREMFSSLEVLDQFKTRFRNVSRIMDCVGCEKCRLWGKLQIMGMSICA